MGETPNTAVQNDLATRPARSISVVDVPTSGFRSQWDDIITQVQTLEPGKSLFVSPPLDRSDNTMLRLAARTRLTALHIRSTPEGSHIWMKGRTEGNFPSLQRKNR